MKENNSLLTGLGFSKTAAQIYLTLLRKGACSIADLARLIGKHRPIVYKALPELVAANLISKSLHGKRSVYTAESPALLSSLHKRQGEEVSISLPALLEIFNNKDNKPKISFFEGKEGIATVYEQLVGSLKKGESLYRYESPKDYVKNKRYYPSLYWKRAGATVDIDKYVITNSKTHQKRHNNLNRFSKAVTVPFEHNITELIAGGRVVIIDYDTETSIVIENPKFAHFQKALYQLLFEKL